MRVARNIVLPLLAIATLSCESSVEPRDGVTLLVVNGSCDPGPCITQRVLAFPGVSTATPGGPWRLDLGLIEGPSLCVTIPASATFQVIGLNPAGAPASTTTYRWTSAMPVSLGLQSGPVPSPTTGQFTPTSADGWIVTLPTQTTVLRGPACTP